MKREIYALLYLIAAVLLFSCRGQGNYATFPVPNTGTLAIDEPSVIGELNIIETKNGYGRNLPLWLRAFLSGGFRVVENLQDYNDKYVFITLNRGDNFAALSKWAEYFGINQDFAVLASTRIERRFYLTSSIYPDDEYGRFFETVIKNANSVEYPGAVKEDTFWIRLRPENEDTTESYVFFIFTTIDKINMQTFIRNMMEQISSDVTANANQTIAINRLRQTFFEGF